MAITRKDIKAILPEIDDEAMKSLMALIHTETDALRDEKDAVESDLKKARDDLDAANKAKGAAEKELSDFKSEQSTKETKAKKEAAYRELLKAEKVADKYIPLILKATDFNSLDLGEDGKFKEAGKISETIRSEHSDFITKVTKNGAKVDSPPAGNRNEQEPESLADALRQKFTNE